MSKKVMPALALLSLSALSAPAAFAGFSANVGYASEYYFRGILQKTSSASAGIDYEKGSFSAGTWAADVGDGLEVDVYGAFSGKISEDLGFSVGATAYMYTGLFDDTYRELNFGLSWSVLSLEVSVGEWSGAAPDEEEYAFIGLTYERNGFYATVGMFEENAEGEYLEFGYGTTVNDIDLGVALIINSEELSDQVDGTGAAREGQAIVFSLTKNFDL